MFKPFIFALSLSGLLVIPAEAQKARRVEQDAAFQATRQGAVRSLRAIENEIVPEMKERGADYIGAEFDGDNLLYRLKFMQGKNVIWIDVDGPTGTIKRTSGK
ncbi:hypothetical protein [Aquisediminimonas profunda]|uniref:hypothetical protein n=1 Tax=Aquisediminimonas profunda TaxID=1550733 RepID=UPI001C635450|nr:hypothetical protein [Aquisediminimonas profunda]